MSPVVEFVFGDPAPPEFGPRWTAEWETHATTAALRDAAGAACTGREITVDSVENPTIRESALTFAYQDPEDPRLAALAKDLDLARVLGAGGDIDKMRRLTSFVRGIADHLETDARNYPSSAPSDAFSILKGVNHGQTLHCYTYSLLLVQALEAAGYTGRIVASGYPIPRTHSSVEAWAPEVNKWVLLDPDFDLLYMANGVPLSAYEVQTTALHIQRSFQEWALREGRPETPAVLPEYIRSHPDLLEGITVLRGTTTSERNRLKMEQSPTHGMIEFYGWFAVAMRNDYLSRRYPFAHPRRWAEAALPIGSEESWADFDGQLTDNVSDLYWPLSRTRIAFSPAGNRCALTVHLGTFTPGFKVFDVAVNESETLETSKASFEWPLRPGENALTVVSVNTQGIQGEPARVRVTVSPTRTHAN